MAEPSAARFAQRDEEFLDAPAMMRRSTWGDTLIERGEAMAAAPSAPPESRSSAGSADTTESVSLGRLLQEVDRGARQGAKQSEGRTGERVTRVPISEDIVLSVRNIEEGDAHLVEKLAKLLRRLGGLV